MLTEVLSFIFDTLYADVATFIFFYLMLFVIRRTFFLPSKYLSTWMLTGDYKSQRRQLDYREHALALLYYFTSTVAAVFVIFTDFDCWYSNNFVTKQIDTQCIESVPLFEQYFKSKKVMLFYKNSGYGVQYSYLLLGCFGAYYIDELIYLLIEAPIAKKDKYIMILHHSYAAAFCYTSIFAGLPVTTLIMITLHDICDVFLCCAKLLDRSGFKNIAILAYVFLVISWISCRLTLFPYIAYMQMRFEQQLGLVLYWLRVTGIPILYIFDVFWFKKILDIATKTKLTFVNYKDFRHDD